MVSYHRRDQNESHRLTLSSSELCASWQSGMRLGHAKVKDAVVEPRLGIPPSQVPSTRVSTYPRTGSCVNSLDPSTHCIFKGVISKGICSEWCVVWNIFCDNLMNRSCKWSVHVFVSGQCLSRESLPFYKQQLTTTTTTTTTTTEKKPTHTHTQKKQQQKKKKKQEFNDNNLLANNREHVSLCEQLGSVTFTWRLATEFGLTNFHPIQFHHNVSLVDP